MHGAINKSHVAMRVANKQLETYLHIARSWSCTNYRLPGSDLRHKPTS